jgi:hypothetical protein
MELKFILVVGLIILIIMYLHNEIKSIKSMINDNNENVMKLLKTKFYTLTNEMKEFNNDLINQTKKINKIHSQKITNMSNYFTDSDSNGVDKNLLNYLSDNKNGDIFKINFNNNDNHNDNNDNHNDNNDNNNDNNENLKKSKTNDDDIISNTSEENDVLNDVLNDVVLNELSESSTTSYNPNNSDNNSERFNQGRLSKCFDEDDNNKSCGTIKSNRNDSQRYQQNDKSHTNNSDKKSTHESVSEKSNNEITNNTELKSNESKRSTQSKQSIKSIKDRHDISEKSILESITNKYDDNINNTVNKNNDNTYDDNNDNNTDDDTDDDKISIEDFQVKSLHDMISFGSKKSKGKKLNLNIGNINNNGNDNDNNSVDSTDIKNMKTLNNIESYNKKKLDDIAKVLKIPLFYKDNSKRISYKKEELYLKIKEKLENKK